MCTRRLRLLASFFAVGFLVVSNVVLHDSAVHLTKSVFKPRWRIDDFRIIRDTLRLRKPVTTGSRKLEKEFILAAVKVRNLEDENLVAWGVGEIAPLEGLSSVNMEEALSQTKRLQSLFRSNPQAPPSWFNSSRSLMTSACRELSDWLGSLFDGSENGTSEKIASSVLSGVEQAFLIAVSRALDIELLQILCDAATDEVHRPLIASAYVELNGLISSNPEQGVEEAAKEALLLHSNGHRYGYRTLKIKLGRSMDPTLDSLMVEGIQQALGPNISLRGDANRAWSLDKAQIFASGLSKESLRLFEYLEEPCQTLENSISFSKQFNVPLALDETIDERGGIPSIGESDGKKKKIIKAAILKPTVLGGAVKCMRLALSERNTDSIISSAFETPFTQAYFALVAGSIMELNRRRVPHGLGTSSWYDRRSVEENSYLSKAAAMFQKNHESLLSLRVCERVIEDCVVAVTEKFDQKLETDSGPRFRD
ncbi:hypothetical protein AAMO2058_000985400 [Amorphochlora amoebiformis]